MLFNHSCSWRYYTPAASQLYPRLHKCSDPAYSASLPLEATTPWLEGMRWTTKLGTLATLFSQQDLRTSHGQDCNPVSFSRMHTRDIQNPKSLD